MKHKWHGHIHLFGKNFVFCHNQIQPSQRPILTNSGDIRRGTGFCILGSICVKESEYRVSADRRNIILAVRPLQTTGLAVLAWLVQINAMVSDMPKTMDVTG